MHLLAEPGLCFTDPLHAYLSWGSPCHSSRLCSWAHARLSTCSGVPSCLFSSSWSWEVGECKRMPSCCLRRACNAMNIPLGTAFAASHRCCVAERWFSWFSGKFQISPLISGASRSLFICMLLGLRVCNCCRWFLLQVISSVMPV